MNNSEENIKNKIPLANLFPKTENKIDPSDIPLQSESQNIPSVSKPASEPFLMKNEEGLGLKLKNLGSKLPETEEKNIPIQDVKLKIMPIKSISYTTGSKDVLPQIPKNNEQIPSPSNVPTGLEGEQFSLNFVDTQKEKTQKIVFKKATAPKSVINLDEINIKPENSLKQEEPPVNQEEEEKKRNFNDFEILSSTGYGEKYISDTVRLRLKPKNAISSAFSNLISEEKPRTNIPEEENNGKAHNSVGNITDSITKSAKENIKYLCIVGALVIIIILLYFLISTITTLMTI